MNKKIFMIITFLSLGLAHYSHSKSLSRSKKTRNISLKKIREKKWVPPTFGKTHFIVGFPHQQFNQEKLRAIHEKTARFLAPHGVVKRALFSPDDNVEETLINLIGCEQDSIKIAIFSFNSQRVANSLKHAADNGVIVEIITDPSTQHSPFTKIGYLAEHDLHIFLYKPIHTKTMMSDKMHDKFILFGKNIYDKPILWTGSFNFTKSAELNQENVVVLDDASLFDQFNRQFNILRNRSTVYQKNMR